VTFTGHLDTVHVADGWSSDPFAPVERDGRLYGLGAVDMKSGLACALAAFERLLRDTTRHPQLGTIGFAATVDEEAYGVGAKALVKGRFGQTDLMLLTEPFHGDEAGDPVPTVMPGKVLYQITVKGRSSHALINPERGVNAVQDAARIVAALDRLPLGVDPVMGRMNYSTLKIEGGYQEYATVVPEHCTVIVTRLLAPGETRRRAVAELEAIVASLGLESVVTVEAVPPSYEPYTLDQNHRATRAFEAAYAARMGQPPVFAGLLGITDANIYQGEAGIPTIIFGPKGKGLHEKDEYVELGSLPPVVDVLVDTAVRFWATSGDG
jgi:acetylornithine deacetylase/succinyl-diaminopimelate desuccinylase-like protein